MSKKKGDGPTVPRDHFVVGHTAGNVSELTFAIDPITGIPSVLELDPTSLRSQISYARKTTDKVLTSSPTDGFAALGESFIDSLRKQFDYLIAVDTNTELTRVDGYKVSACCICSINVPLASVTETTPYEHLAAYLILDSGDEGNAELLGWHLVATVHINTPFLRTQRVGVIVDSELGDHVAINARTKPYYGNHLLPDNMTLVYASDAAAETFINGMIKMNDRNAGGLIEAVKQKGLSTLQLQGGVKLGTAICHCITATAPTKPKK
ncbi:hypothetical protein [Pseudomonas sp. P97.38]|jgi:hypothetical protein|uniref:hypothetical protein n=1 Tax=Pseudomonas sp. P97.38 TaxID=255451 RepID=UPI00069FE701|nr:hypothetical protein [Pseudomonas sp. P97.38]